MILITGGTGLVGSHLIMELLSAGAKVRALKRPESRTDLIPEVFEYYGKSYSSYSSNLEWRDADLLDFDDVYDALDGVETVYHCAAIVSFDPSDKNELLRLNPGSTATLVNASLEAGVKTFCHISSVAALGRESGKDLIDENNWWTPSKANSNYSISKFSAEREVWRASEEGLNVVIVNPSIIIGPGNWTRGTGKLFTTALKGFPFYTKGVTGFVSARDVAKAAYSLVKSGIRNERFIVSSENMAWQKFFSLIAENLNKKPPGIFAGPFLSSLAWRIDKIKSKVTGKKPVITRESADAAHSRFYYSSDKIKSSAGFEFTPLEEVIKHTTECLKRDIKNGKLLSSL